MQSELNTNVVAPMGCKEVIHPLLSNVSQPKAVPVTGQHHRIRVHIAHTLKVDNEHLTFGGTECEMTECLGRMPCPLG
jgi:hypothetical protein